MKKSEERALEMFPTHNGASKEWTKHHLSGSDCATFIKGYEQAIEDCIEWMKNNLCDENTYIGIDEGRTIIDTERVIINFTKNMIGK